jgi:hypothetical protein
MWVYPSVSVSLVLLLLGSAHQASHASMHRLCLGLHMKRVWLLDFILAGSGSGIDRYTWYYYSSRCPDTIKGPAAGGGAFSMTP